MPSFGLSEFISGREVIYDFELENEAIICMLYTLNLPLKLFYKLIV